MPRPKTPAFATRSSYCTAVPTAQEVIDAHLGIDFGDVNHVVPVEDVCALVFQTLSFFAMTFVLVRQWTEYSFVSARR